MRKSAHLLLFFALTASSLQADIIYSNFGVNPVAPYDSGNGDTVAVGGQDLSTSFSFVIPADHSYQLTGIDFAAYLVSGTNAIIASIYDDNGGVPGNLIYTTGEIDSLLQPPNEIPTFNEEIEESVTNGPLLNTGSTYWLSLDAVQSDSFIAWSYNGQGVDGSGATGGPGNWTTGPKEQGAFEIDAVIASPEPVTTVLVGSGLAMVGFLNRHRFIKRPSPTIETF